MLINKTRVLSLGALVGFTAAAVGVSSGSPTKVQVHPPQTRPNLSPQVRLDASGVAPRFWRLLHFGSKAPQPRRNAFVLGARPDGGKAPNALAVSDFGTGAVEVLDHNYNLAQTITSGLNGPDGDWYDAKGYLYVANYAGVNVQEYAPNGTTPIFTYSTDLTDPVAVTTDVARDVFVADYANGGAGVVVEYPQGSNTPSKMCSTGLSNEGIVVDSSGNVFVSGNNPNTGSGNIIEFTGGLGSCSGTVLGVTLGFAGGMQMDKSGNLVAIDQFSGVDLIPYPYSAISGTCGTGYSDAFHNAFNKKGDLLFVADVGNANVQVLSYPACSPVTTLASSNGLSDPAGVAAVYIPGGHKKKKGGGGPAYVGNWWQYWDGTGVQPTDFEVEYPGDLRANIPSVPLYGIYDAFCPPSQTCLPQVTYNSTTNTTTLEFAGSTLYPNSHTNQYHFGLLAAMNSYGEVFTPVKGRAFWTYPSQQPAPQPWISVNWDRQVNALDTSLPFKYAVVYVEGRYQQSGPATFGGWFSIPYIPPASGQPKFTFNNYTGSTIYVTRAGVVLNLPVPDDPACQQNPACPENMDILQTLNYGSYPPPGDSGSPFQSLQYPPKKALKTKQF